VKKRNTFALKSGKYLKSVLPFDCVQILENEILCVTQPKNVLFVLAFLKDHVSCQYKILTAISGTDFPERYDRFEISYELLSIKYNTRLRIKTFVNENVSLQSASIVYSSANWWEREIWDMFGLYFTNHPDLRRILTDYGFEGFPLRKDFPLSGYVEVRYDDAVKRVVCEPLEFAQEYRSFKFESPWSKSVGHVSNAFYKKIS
jgi:NADH/F420H2 dehydrogenase subunit C